jgi:uncharacterized protein
VRFPLPEILILALCYCACGEGAGVQASRPPTAGAAISTDPREMPGESASVATAPSSAADGTSPPERGRDDRAGAGVRGPAAPPVGYLEGFDRLEHFFDGLAELDGGLARDDVRILQYGDSHTASDLGVAVFRRVLQARFADGGRGFVPLGRPWKWYGQENVHGGMTNEFEAVRLARFAWDVDAAFGLLGVALDASRAGGRAWTDVTARSSRIEVAYLQQPRGGSFDVLLDGTQAGRVATRADQIGSGFYPLEAAEAPHNIEVRTVGDGQVRIFGLTLDRLESGVVVDTLGINGAQIATMLRWSEGHFREQLRHATPALVVLAYGTNEALDPKLVDTEYEAELIEVLGRIARASPDAACLLLGPPDLARRTVRAALGGTQQDDWHTWPRILQIVAVQRHAARQAGCAFYDQLAAMGGPGSIAAWAVEAQPRAQRDRVHMTASGYAQLGASFATDLMRAYDTWRADKKLPPTFAPRTWGDSSYLEYSR